MTTRTHILHLTIAGAIALFPGTSVFAQWQANGVAACAAQGEQLHAVCGGDGQGTVTSWDDYRNGTGDIFAQKLDALGNALWQANGVLVCGASNHQLAPVLCGDGAGGAIIVWEDYRAGLSAGDIYAQRVSSSGQTLWSANGVAVCTASGVQMRPVIASDGQGGAFIAWEDYRGSSANVYVQRIDALGAATWSANGIPVATVQGARYVPAIAATNGDVVIAWEENRTGSEFDLYAQRLNAGGTALWGGDALAICTVTGVQAQIAAVADASGAVYLAWQDYRSGNPDMYGQKLGNGAVLWSANGVSVCSASGTQEEPAIVGDGAGGAIVAWADYRSNQGNIHAQRIGAQGAALWVNDGIAVCAAQGTQHAPGISTDGAGGAVIAWADYRVAAGDVYAQRVDANGTAIWTANGVGVCTASGTQMDPVLAADGGGGAVVLWTDYRGGAGDIFTQRINQHGTPLPVTLELFSAERIDGDVLLRWRSSAEWNVLGYEVHSSKGDGTWRREGFVAALAHNGASYEFRVLAPTSDRFRLRIIDTDGSEDFGPELRVNSMPISILSELTTHPTPAHDHVNLSFEAPPGLPMHISIADIAGRNFVSDTHLFSSGGRQWWRVSLAGLPPGTYLLRIASPSAQRQRLIVVAR